MTNNYSSQAFVPSVPQLSTPWNTKDIPINEVTSFNYNNEYQIFLLCDKQYNKCLNFFRSDNIYIDIDKATSVMTAKIEGNKRCPRTSVSKTTLIGAHLYDSFEN